MGALALTVIAPVVLVGKGITFDSGEIAHLRPSGNAPELRCYNEADSPERVAALNRDCLAVLVRRAAQRTPLAEEKELAAGVVLDLVRERDVPVSAGPRQRQLPRLPFGEGQLARCGPGQGEHGGGGSDPVHDSR